MIKENAIFRKDDSLKMMTEEGENSSVIKRYNRDERLIFKKIVIDNQTIDDLYMGSNDCWLVDGKWFSFDIRRYNKYGNMTLRIHNYCLFWNCDRGSDKETHPYLSKEVNVFDSYGNILDHKVYDTEAGRKEEEFDLQTHDWYIRDNTGRLQRHGTMTGEIPLGVAGQLMGEGFIDDYFSKRL